MDEQIDAGDSPHHAGWPSDIIAVDGGRLDAVGLVDWAIDVRLHALHGNHGGCQLSSGRRGGGGDVIRGLHICHSALRRKGMRQQAVDSVGSWHKCLQRDDQLIRKAYPLAQQVACMSWHRMTSHDCPHAWPKQEHRGHMYCLLANKHAH